MALSWAECCLIVLLLVFPLVWQSSHVVRYYVKTVLYDVWILLCAAGIIPILLFQPKNVINISYMQWWWNKTLPIFGVTVELRDTHNLKYDKPRVIVCNHQNSIDLTAMMQVLPPRTTILAKKELLYAGPFGIASWLGGLIFIDRSNHEKAHETMEKVAQRMHKDKVSVWIYPEGTRNSDGHLLPFKKGAFRLAIQAKVPIFPLVFSSYQDFLCTKRKIFNEGRVVVTCLPMISTEDLTLDDIPSLMERTYEAMTTVYEKVSKEVHEQAVKEGHSIMGNSSH